MQGFRSSAYVRCTVPHSLAPLSVLLLTIMARRPSCFVSSHDFVEPILGECRQSESHALVLCCAVQAAACCFLCSLAYWGRYQGGGCGSASCMGCVVLLQRGKRIVVLIPLVHYGTRKVGHSNCPVHSTHTQIQHACMTNTHTHILAPTKTFPRCVKKPR